MDSAIKLLKKSMVNFALQVNFQANWMAGTSLEAGASSTLKVLADDVNTKSDACSSGEAAVSTDKPDGF